MVLAGNGDPLGLLAGAAAKLHLQPGPCQQACERRAHRAGADDRGGAQGGDAAEPLVLKLDAGPDTGGHLAGEMRGRVVDAREGQRPAAADAHLARADDEAAPGALGPHDGDRHDRRAGLEREAADAPLGVAERSAPDARALREDEDRLAARDELAGGLHRLLVGLAAANRKGAERVEEPAHPAALEELALRDEVDGAPEAYADDPGVKEAAVVRSDDHAAAGGDVLAPDPLEPEEQHEQRLQHDARGPVDERIDPSRARARVISAQVASHALSTHIPGSRYAASDEA